MDKVKALKDLTVKLPELKEEHLLYLSGVVDACLLKEHELKVGDENLAPKSSASS